MLSSSIVSQQDPSNYTFQPDDCAIHLDSCYCVKADKEMHPTWSELQQLEDERREILKRAELPFWRILLYWTGTCLKALALDWLIWVTIAIYVCIRVQARLLWADEAPEVAELLSKADTSVLGGFLSFFLVLFVNQTNTRFFEMYGFSKACAGRIQDIAGLVSTYCPTEVAAKMTRQLNAAHILGYVGLGGPYSKRHFFDHFNAKYDLLTVKELRQIQQLKMDSGGDAFKELVTWCQRDVERAEKAGYIDGYKSMELHKRILDFRASMDGIYDYTDQPVHFFYIHFLCLLSALYLPLFAFDNAYAAGWGDDVDWSIEFLYGVIVLLQCIFVVGLRLLGQKMIDPYGDDLEDLSVITYVASTLENCKIILASKLVQDDDESAHVASTLENCKIILASKLVQDDDESDSFPIDTMRQNSLIDRIQID